MAVDVTIVGSGAGGTAAALRLADLGLRPLILDVGKKPAPDAPLRENFYRLREHSDVFDVMIGRDLEQIQATAPEAAVLPAKLTPPRMRFITEDGQRLSPLAQDGFAAVQSFARGGLGNAWGAGMMRSTDRDLLDFPIRAADLAPYYDRLTREIGISGEADDLLPFFGSAAGLQPALQMSRKASSMMAKYRRRQRWFQRHGMFFGRPRLGVLSRATGDRPACDYGNLEFWEPDLPFIYTPATTLRRLVDRDLVTYRQNVLVHSWSRSGDVIRVHGRDLRTDATVTFDTRVLLLAAGAIGSARLALQSRGDTSTRLTLLDNPAIQFPMVLPRFIGRGLETDCFGLTQLSVVCDWPEYRTPLQASILEITSPARAEFFSSIPLAARDRLRAIRSLVPAMLVMQLFLPMAGREGAALRLEADGRLRIEAASPPSDAKLIGRFAQALWRLGAITHRSLVRFTAPGQGIHYAGTLPMSAVGDAPYACDRHGRLGQEPGVYVVDGASLPALPAKNFSFTMMANAMRVAEHVAQTLARTIHEHRSTGFQPVSGQHRQDACATSDARGNPG